VHGQAARRISAAFKLWAKRCRNRSRMEPAAWFSLVLQPINTLPRSSFQLRTYTSRELSSLSIGSAADPILDSFLSLGRALLEPGGPSYETKRLLRCKVNCLNRSTQTLVAQQVPLHDKSCSRRPLASSTLTLSFFGQLPKSRKATPRRQL
jgi:hypothetical protein